MAKNPVVITQLQIEMSTELKRKLKKIAFEQEISLKEAVINALIESYPELREDGEHYLISHTRLKRYY